MNLILLSLLSFSDVVSCLPDEVSKANLVNAKDQKKEDPFKSNPDVTKTNLVVEIQKPSTSVNKGTTASERSSLGDDSETIKATKDVKQAGEIPILSDGNNPVQISLIITNGMDSKEKGQALSEEKKGEKPNNRQSSLSEMLLKPTHQEKSEKLDEEDMASLLKLSARLKNASMEIQKISDSLNKVIKKSKDHPERENSEHPKDLVNYHVIEITENKSK